MLRFAAEREAAGVFRMPMPAAWGGSGMSPRAQNGRVESLSVPFLERGS